MEDFIWETHGIHTGTGADHVKHGIDDIENVVRTNEVVRNDGSQSTCSTTTRGGGTTTRRTPSPTKGHAGTS